MCVCVCDTKIANRRLYLTTHHPVVSVLWHNHRTPCEIDSFSPAVIVHVATNRQKGRARAYVDVEGGGGGGTRLLLSIHSFVPFSALSPSLCVWERGVGWGGGGFIYLSHCPSWRVERERLCAYRILSNFLVVFIVRVLTISVFWGRLSDSMSWIFKTKRDELFFKARPPSVSA